MNGTGRTNYGRTLGVFLILVIATAAVAQQPRGWVNESARDLPVA